MQISFSQVEMCIASVCLPCIQLHMQGKNCQMEENDCICYSLSHSDPLDVSKTQAICGYYFDFDNTIQVGKIQGSVLLENALENLENFQTSLLNSLAIGNFSPRPGTYWILCIDFIKSTQHRSYQAHTAQILSSPHSIDLIKPTQLRADQVHTAYIPIRSVKQKLFIVSVILNKFINIMNIFW